MPYLFLNPSEKCTSSLGQEAVSSAASFSDIPQSVLSKLNLTGNSPCSKDSETESCQSSPFGMTLKPSMEHHGEDLLTSSALAFHAQTSPSPASERESRESSPDCGKRRLGSLARLDPVTSLWKTRQLCLLEESDESLATFPRWGSMENGELFQDDMLEVRLKENAFLLPAPTKVMAKRGWGISSVKPRYSAILEENARIFGYKPH